MWENLSLTSPKKQSVRRILTYALAALSAAFLWTILLSPTTHAADASWKGSTIQYGGNDYTGPTSAKTVKDLGLLDGTKAYTYVEPASTTAGSATSPTRQIHVIFFAPGVDSSVATSAKYRTYIYQGPSNFTSPSTPVDIALTKQSTSPNPGTSSCTVDSGVGWIVCPITNFLAKRMDNVFSLLSGFLAVRPVETGQDNALFRAWSYMRGFANVAFVIAFLVIIYSQLTSIGITNYSAKKLLPRLIIAALLVNLSYYICSIVVDLSNILGYSIQDIFIQLRNSLVGTEGNSWNVTSWESVTGLVLSGGLATAGGIALFSTLSIYGAAGSIILLMPALVTGLVAVLVALVVMATRQALITILIIIAPLAFVAYLLPNTEKWFDKWRSTFMTMLILFPAFSVIFGGSQLAAAAIIQNADSINLIILGMLVQVAPLLITPTLIKLSGSLVGRIAGMVNNPNKGLIDRTKNWSKERSDDKKAKRMSTVAQRGQLMKRYGQNSDRKRRVREADRKHHEARADNIFDGSADGRRLYQTQHDIESDKKIIEEELSTKLSAKIQVTPEMLKKEMLVRLTADESATEKAKLDKVHDDVRAQRYNPNPMIGEYPTHVLSDLSARSERATKVLAMASIGSQFAKRKQQIQQADAVGANTELIDGQTIRQYAGGIDGLNGQKSVLASAMNVQHDAEVKIVNERAQMMRQFNVNGGDMHIIATGTGDVKASYTSESGQAYTYTFARGDIWTQDAAIETQLQIGSLKQKLEIMELSGIDAAHGGLIDFVKTIKSGMASNNLGAQAIFLGGRTIDTAGRGDIKGHEGLLAAAAAFILEGKYKDEDMANNGPQAIAILLEAAQKATGIKPADRAQFDIFVRGLKESADKILDDEVNVGRNASVATKDMLTELSRKLTI